MSSFAAEGTLGESAQAPKTICKDENVTEQWQRQRARHVNTKTPGDPERNPVRDFERLFASLQVPSSERSDLVRIT
eukprot:1039139-Pyramimonas_sp.AAC.1